MKKIAHELLLLLINLSQIKNNNRIIEMFSSAINEVIPNVQIHYSSQFNAENNKSCEICTIKKSFGYIVFNGDEECLTDEIMGLLHNAAQMLGLILEKNEQDQQLEFEKNDLLKLVHERTKELHGSEKKYKDLVEMAQEGIWVYDENAITTFVNLALAEIIGYTAKEMLGKPIYNFIAKDMQQITKDRVNDRRSGEKGLYDFTFIHKDGRHVLTTVVSTPLFDSAGQFKGSLAGVIDVTQRALSEIVQRVISEISQLFLNSDNLDYLYSIIPQILTERTQFPISFIELMDLENKNIYLAGEKGLLYHTPKTKIDEKNPVLNKIVISEKPYIWTNNKPLVIPNGVPGKNEIRTIVSVPMFSQNKFFGSIAVCDYTKRPDAELYVQILQIAAYHLAREIERKNAENQILVEKKRAQKYLDIANVMIIALDKFGNITLVNKKGCEILGLTEKEIIGLNWFENFIPPEIKETIHSVFKKIMALTPTLIASYENNIISKTGEIKLIDWRNSAIIDDNGNYIGILSSGEDITQRKNAEIQIKNDLHEKELLLKEIHHRVKNNMQIMTSLLNLQAQNIKDPETHKFFEDSKNRIYSMALVHENLYRSQSLAKINLKDYIDKLVYDLVSVYHSTLSVKVKKNIQDIQLGIDQAIPCGLLLNEMITNSLKHAFDINSLGIIHISAVINNNQLSLVYSDNGKGLSSQINMDSIDTLGLRLIKLLSSQLNGELLIDHNNGLQYSLTFLLK